MTVQTLAENILFQVSTSFAERCRTLRDQNKKNDRHTREGVQGKSRGLWLLWLLFNTNHDKKVLRNSSIWVEW